MLNNTGIALMAGFLLDLAIGDPRWLYHPVRLIGKVIDLLEKIFRKILPKTPRGELAGGAMLVIGTLAVTGMVSFGLLYLAYQLFGRLSESTGLSYTVSMAAMVLFAAGGAGIMIFGIRQLILLAKNGASEFDKQPGPSEPNLSENVSSENENNSEK